MLLVVISTHNIGFNEEMTKTNNYQQISSNMHIICSSDLMFLSGHFFFSFFPAITHISDAVSSKHR